MEDRQDILNQKEEKGVTLNDVDNVVSVNPATHGHDTGVNSTTALNLLKYDSPVLKCVKIHRGVCVPKPSVERKIEARTSHVSKEYCQKVRTIVDQDFLFNKVEMKSIMDNLYPPIEFTQDRCVYQKYISTEKATQVHIVEMVNQLVQLCKDPNVLAYGVSDVVLNIWTQAFDECIRQIFVDRPVLGILFRRIRDLTLQELENQKRLFLSAAAFGARKDLQLNQQILEMRNQIDKNAERKQGLLHQLHELTEKKEHVEEKFLKQKKHDELEFMTESTTLLNEKRKLVNELRFRTELKKYINI